MVIWIGTFENHFSLNTAGSNERGSIEYPQSMYIAIKSQFNYINLGLKLPECVFNATEVNLNDPLTFICFRPKVSRRSLPDLYRRIGKQGLFLQRTAIWFKEILIFHLSIIPNAVVNFYNDMYGK